MEVKKAAVEPLPLEPAICTADSPSWELPKCLKAGFDMVSPSLTPNLCSPKRYSRVFRYPLSNLHPQPFLCFFLLLFLRACQGRRVPILFSSPALNDPVDHPPLHEVFGPLESFGQLLLMVCSITAGRPNPMIALGSARIISPTWQNSPYPARGRVG